MTSESVTIDRLDRQLLHALRIDGRVAFRVLAGVLGVSEQTVARRYRRLREAGVVRVLVLPVPRPGLDWVVRMQVAPGGAPKLARALAARADVSWVTINSGGAEVTCASRPGSTRQRDELLLQRLPQTNLVTGLVAHATLHTFAGGGVNERADFDDPLTVVQAEAIRRARAAPPQNRPETTPGAHSPADLALLAALAEDGRAGYTALAEATDSTPGRVRRRLETMLSGGTSYVDADLALDALGFPTLATVWMTVAPSRLAEVGGRLAEQRETVHVAALSGQSNLRASIVARDHGGLYTWVTERLGTLDGIERAEVTPVLRLVKQAGTVIEGTRISPPF